MNKYEREQKTQLVTAGIWSLAVLAVLAIGLLTFFSAASRRTENKDRSESSKQVQTESVGTAETTPPETKDVSVTDAVTEPPKEDPKPAADAGATADTEADVIASSYPTGENFRCVMPINGTVTKDHTEDVAVYSLTMNDYRVHDGIDIGAPIGTPVMACAAGTVERVWEDPFLGTCIQINHGGDIRSMYANLSPTLPKNMEAGATVLEGDVIGGVGETMTIEMADTDHLHFSMTLGGISVDPMDYITNYTHKSAEEHD